MQRLGKTTLVLTLTCAAAPHFTPTPASAQPPTRIAPALQWRSIGPAIAAGRISDVEIVPGSQSHIYLGAASGGRVGERQPRHDLDPGLRRPAQPVRWRHCAGPVGPNAGVGRDGRAQQPQQLPVGTGRLPLRRRRRDVDGSPAWRRPVTSAGWSCIPPTPTRCGSPRSATSSAPTRSAACIAPPTGAPPGSRSSTSTKTRASWTSPSTRPTRPPSTRPPTSGSGERGGSSGAGPVAASTRAPTAATPGAS